MNAVTLALVERVRRFAMPDGPVTCRGTWLRQQGEMRFAADTPWQPFEAEQWFPGDGIDFRWEARIRVAPLVRARVVDAFERGSGALTAKVFGVFPLVRSRGPAMDKAEALRSLAELPWRPFAFRESPLLTWEATTDEALGCRFYDGRTRAAVEFRLGPSGDAVDVTAFSRPRLVRGNVVETPWSAAGREYRVVDGLRVPMLGEATWHLPEGPFTCFRGRVVEFRVLR